MLQQFMEQRTTLNTSTVSRKGIRKLSLLFSLLLLSRVSSASALDALHQSWTGKAIDGYDPVAYFTNGEPTEGVKKFQHEWNDATWYFVSEQNLKII